MKKEIIIALIFGLAIIGYGGLNYMAKIQALKHDEEAEYREDLRKQQQQSKLSDCLSLAEKTYNWGWDEACKAWGREKECLLPNHQAEVLNDSFKIEKDNCIKIFGK